jgi:hypothetical protein
MVKRPRWHTKGSTKHFGSLKTDRERQEATEKQRLNRHSPDSGLVVGHDRPFGCLGQWYIAHRVRSRQSNQPVDCAEALKRAGLPVSRRTFAVVACPI